MDTWVFYTHSDHVTHPLPPHTHTSLQYYNIVLSPSFSDVLSGLWLLRRYEGSLRCISQSMCIFGIYRPYRLPPCNDTAVSYNKAEWCRFFIHLRSLNLPHFKIAEAIKLKITVLRSLSMTWPLRWISLKSNSKWVNPKLWITSPFKVN
jgi:hypothetical protein